MRRRERKGEQKRGGCAFISQPKDQPDWGQANQPEASFSYGCSAGTERRAPVDADAVDADG